MPEIRLLELKLRNFKGIKDFTFTPAGENCAVFGDNETGKTTLVDSCYWLFFDKDSQGKQAFAIKTLTQEGEALHNLEHEVEGTIDISGKKMVLKKIYSEIWTKKRGTVKKELTGNTTDHFVDGVPKTKSEYQAIIKDIASEDLFKLLTSPEFFNTQLHWQERRKILLDVCGDIKDADVIASDPKLKDLGHILMSRKIEDHKKVITAKRKEINDELEKIPVRIDEVYRGLPDINGIDIEKEKKVIDDIEINIKAENALLNQIESGGAVAEKTIQMKTLAAEMFDIKTTHRGTVQIEIDKVEKERRELTGKLEHVSRKGVSLEGIVIEQLQEINRHNESIKVLRTSWTDKNEAGFEFTQDRNCPTCGQSLPEEKLKAAHDKALTDFNIKKAEEMESITAHGQELSAKVKELETKLADTEKEAKSAAEEQTELQDKITALNKALEPLNISREKYQDNPEYTLLAAKYASIEQEIITLKNGAAADTQVIKDKITALETDQTEAKNKLDLVEKAKMGNKRIADLTAGENRLTEEFENLERVLYLIEQFTKAKVDMLESKINHKFELARFKMFEEQVNGGLNDKICETTYKGVPYSTGLNNGGRINVGLDICRTLSDHYGVQLPIFIDNSEAITNPIKLKGQMIQMFVSEKDKSLRVETEKPALAVVV